MSTAPKTCPQCGTHYHAAATFCQVDGSPLVRDLSAGDPLVGTTLLGQFEVLEAMGAGGMGAVYRAHQAELGRDVAVKVLHRDLANNPDAVRRFQREARVATSLDHENLVDVYLFGALPDGSLYLVMEHLAGRTLERVLVEDSPIPLARALKVAYHASLGIGAAHEKGIVHRDVKPENIMLVTEKGDPDTVKVLDFGVARLLWDEQSHATQSGVVFGTARYISPEGASGEATDTRSDVYSLAVLTYQLLTGELPFDDPSPVALLMKHLRDRPPSLRSLPGGKDVPEPIAEVVMRGLAKHPDARVDDAGSYARALLRAAEECGVAITPAMARAATRPGATVPQTARPSSAGDVRAAAAPQRSPMATQMQGTHSTPFASPRAPLAHGAPNVGGGTTDKLVSEDALGSAPGRGVHQMPVVTPGMLPAAHASLDSASAMTTSPRADPGLSVPGIAPGRPRLATLALAAALGGLLMGAGIFAWHQIGEHERSEQQAHLETRAREALSRGAIDTPPGDNVVELTARLLESDPAHAGARAIRRETALLLRERAATARATGDLGEAQASYEQVLRIFPEDAVALEGLRVLAANPALPGMTGPDGMALSPGVRTAPESPRAGEPTRLIGVFGVALPPDVVPEFTIFRGSRRVERVAASPGQTSGEWIADVNFARSGEHSISLEFGVGAQRVMLRHEVEVVRLRRGTRRSTTTSPAPDVTSPSLPPPPGETEGAGPVGASRPLGPPMALPPPDTSGGAGEIDWTPPPPPPTEMTETMESEPAEPPAPWTG